MSFELSLYRLSHLMPSSWVLVCRQKILNPPLVTNPTEYSYYLRPDTRLSADLKIRNYDLVEDYEPLVGH
jgi:hypothetical protein